MNDPRYRNPARLSHPHSWRDPREDSGAPAPEVHEDFGVRPPRRSREPGGVSDRRSLRGPGDPGVFPGRRLLGGEAERGLDPQRRPLRERDYADPDFERRRPRRPRGPRPPDAERAGRGVGMPGEREGWPGPRARSDWEAGMRPRRPGRPSGKPRRKGKAAAARRLRWRYRLGALVGVMLFATVGGVCLGFSGIGGSGANVGLIAAGIPALLLGMGCAAAYVYF